MNIKEIAQLKAEEKFKREDMTSSDWYGYEYYIKGFIDGYSLKNDDIPQLPFGEGNKLEKY